MSNEADSEGFFSGTGFQPVIPLKKSTQLGTRKRPLPDFQMPLPIYLAELDWLPQDSDFQTNHRLEACATEESQTPPFRDCWLDWLRRTGFPTCHSSLSGNSEMTGWKACPWSLYILQKNDRHGGRLLRKTESASYVAAGLRAGVLLRTEAAIRTAALGSVGMTKKCCMPGRKAYARQAGTARPHRLPACA